MKKLIATLAVGALVCIVSCAYPYGRQNYKSLQIEMLELEMTKSQVKLTLGRGPSSVAGSKREGGHLVEVWYYLKAYFNWIGGEDKIQNEYWLFFLDGKLERWTDQGEWEHEATDILEVRIKQGRN